MLRRLQFGQRHFLRQMSQGGFLYISATIERIEQYQNGRFTGMNLSSVVLLYLQQLTYCAYYHGIG